VLDPSHRVDGHHSARLVEHQQGCLVTPGKQDITELRERIRLRVDKLRRDRNENRAHVFELGGNAAMLSLEEVSELFDYLEEILNDLRLLASDSTMAMNTPFSIASPKLTARVWVDRIVLGARSEVRADRDDIYQKLHKSHAEHPEREQFNIIDGEALIAPAYRL
jgi:hypothetical protein